MNFFLSFFQSKKQHGIPAYSFWEYYIKNGIIEAGHTWSECPGVDWAEGIIMDKPADQLKWKADAWCKTVNWLKNNPADVFLSYLFPQQVDHGAIAEIKRSGIPCVNFYCDNVRDFKKLPALFSVFDLNWVPEYKAIKFYQKAGYPYINLPMPMWVEPRYRVLREENNKQVTFIGSKDIQRQMFLEKALQQNPEFPLAVYGHGWIQPTNQPKAPHSYPLSRKLLHQFEMINQQGVLPFLRKLSNKPAQDLTGALRSCIKGTPDFEDYNLLTAASMITLGINRYPSFHFPLQQPNSYSRLRDIEAPMLGACYLTEWTAGIEDLYTMGQEIETYKSQEELAEKVKQLQGDAIKRRDLKINGQKRALTTHNIPTSLNKILCALGL